MGSGTWHKAGSVLVAAPRLVYVDDEMRGRGDGQSEAGTRSAGSRTTRAGCDVGRGGRGHPSPLPRERPRRVSAGPRLEPTPCGGGVESTLAKRAQNPQEHLVLGAMASGHRPRPIAERLGPVGRAV